MCSWGRAATPHHEAGEDQKDLVPAGDVSGRGGDRQTCGAANEAHDLQPNAANFVYEKDGAHDADDQKQIDEASALRSQDVVVDEVGKASDVSRYVANRGGEDCRRKDTNAIGSEILKKPRNRGAMIVARMLVLLNRS